jgi:hypothetical protein
MKITIIWDITLCSLIQVYRRFRGAYYLHHHSDECETSVNYRRNIPKHLTSSVLDFEYENCGVKHGETRG